MVEEIKKDLKELEKIKEKLKVIEEDLAKYSDDEILAAKQSLEEVIGYLNGVIVNVRGFLYRVEIEKKFGDEI